jgi:hypothetical protein
MAFQTMVTRTLIRKLPVLCILFSQNTQKSNFMKIRQWEPSCSTLTDTNAQTDMTMIKVALRNFAKAPMNSSTIKCTPTH